MCLRHCHGLAGGARQGKVGDGGASWRLKALARAKAQSGDASDPNFGRKSGDIVSEQWGSLSELTAGLQNSRAAHGESWICVVPGQLFKPPCLSPQSAQATRQPHTKYGHSPQKSPYS